MSMASATELPAIRELRMEPPFLQAFQRSSGGVVCALPLSNSSSTSCSRGQFQTLKSRCRRGPPKKIVYLPRAALSDSSSPSPQVFQGMYGPDSNDVREYRPPSTRLWITRAYHWQFTSYCASGMASFCNNLQATSSLQVTTCCCLPPTSSAPATSTSASAITSRQHVRFSLKSLQHGWRMKKQINVVPTIQKRCSVVRGATTEDIEAEKELIEEDALERMEKTLESVKSNFNTVRTGRASPALLDRVEVEYYGTMVSLKSMAQVSTPDGSCLLIQPFDKSSLSSIEKAISKSDVGLTPSNDGNAIRLYIPPLTEERRKELLKMVAKLSEEGKIAIRNIRRDAIRSYEKLEKEKQLSADNVKDLSASMQKITDGYIKKVEALFKQKEKELSTV